MQLVLEKLRLKVEDKVNVAASESVGLAEVVDLELEEPPETLLISCVKGNTENKKEAVVNSMRFLWEVYKLSLDLLKTNGRMVAAYKDSAISAINFCDKYKRPSECRKLSEILRSHLQNILRIQSMQTQSSLTYMMKLDDDTLSNLIPIREKLMEVCMKLSLWQEAFRAADDTRVLICEGKASPSTLARYWHALSKIFWKAGQNLFHAYALYLFYYQNKKHNKKFTNEGTLASTIVLSTLAVPTYNLGTDITGIIADSILSQEINARLSTMLIQSGMVTREQLIDLIHSNNLLELASKEARELFYLLENKFLPLTLSHLVKPLLSKIKENNEFKAYATAIEQLLVGRVLAQLSKCYKSLRLETLSKLIDFIPSETLEKYILEVSLKTSLRIKIDQSNNAIYFEDIHESSEHNSQSCKIKEILLKTHSLIIKPKDMEERKNTIANVFSDIEGIVDRAFEFRQSLTDDGKKINKDRDETQRKKEEDDKKAKEQEKKKLEEEMKLREKTQKLASSLNDIERERRNIKLSIIYSIIEKMRAIGFSSKEMSLQGKKVEKMTDDELLEMGPDEFGKLYSRLYEKSVKDRQIQVKNQQKSLEYNERAKREYMNPLIQAKWAESTQQEVDTKKQVAKDKYEKDFSIKQQFIKIKDFKAEFILEETTKAKAIYDKVYNEWTDRMKAHYKTQIIENAKKKRSDDKLAKIEEEKRIKEENERKRRADDNKTKERERDIGNYREKEVPKPIAGWRNAAIAQAPPPPPAPVRAEPQPSSSSSSMFRNPQTVQQKPADKPGLFRSKAPTEPVKAEETKAESGPSGSSGPPKRFTNIKKKKEETKDSEGFTKVTKDITHHK